MSFTDSRIRPASPACFTWRWASSMASGLMSLPDTFSGRVLPSSNFFRASARMASSAPWGAQGQASMANLRVRPGARFSAMNAASISIVPVPQQGSYSGCQGCQPLCSTSAAASVSRRGASPFQVR